MKRIILCTFLAVASVIAVAAPRPVTAPKGGKPISDMLLGIFFEDISSSADGGLSAELIQNGSFEFNANERDGWGPSTAWRLLRPGHSLGYAESRMDAPLHQNNPTYMRLHTERVGHYYDYAGWTGFGLQNDGFDGIRVCAGESYDFSAFVRIVGTGSGQLRVALVEHQPNRQPLKLLADTTLTFDATNWQQISARLTPAEASSHASLQLLSLQTGVIDIDYISLMPVATFKGHGLRQDLAQALADLQPKFMRFPGGCVVHGGGDGFWNTYRWKTTIGPRHERRQLKNTWGYHQSMALGYYEYFQFCEDLNMEPLPILPCGVSCQGTNGGWGMRGQAQDVVPMTEMDEWVQDALDLIEWANGDATTTWGARRAAQGHPQPFGLKYLGIGNEEKISPEFEERFRYIYNKVHEAYPDIIIVGTAGPGSHRGNPDYDNDEHYYEPRNYFLTSRQYDSYPRERTTKVYLGEYAAKDKKLIDALAEGLYLLHVERNADVVTMTSYAPLFARRGATNWNPDLIYFDNERPYLTCSYYIQQLFGLSAGDYYYGDCVRFEGDAADVCQPVENSSYGQSVVLNTRARRLYVKLCNASDQPRTAKVDISRFSVKSRATQTTITGHAEEENNYDAQPIAPQKQDIKAKRRFDIELQPFSFIMLEYQL